MINLDFERLSRPEVIASYEAHFRQPGVLRESDAFYHWVLRKLGVQPGARLLDVASGEGYLLKAVRQRGLTGISVDFSRTATQLAGQHAALALVGDGHKLPLADASFDYVTNIGSLEHFIAPQAGLREMRRLLRPDGKAALLLPNSFYLLDIIWHVWRRGYTVSHKQAIERFATKNEWRDLIEGAGFRVWQVHCYNLAFPVSWADIEWYRRRPRKIVSLLLSPLIPTNLSYSFLYIADKN
jgi:SAM-dependent methyltransferase